MTLTRNSRAIIAAVRARWMGPGRSWRREREDGKTILPGGNHDGAVAGDGLPRTDVRTTWLLQSAASRLFGELLCAVLPGRSGRLRRAGFRLERAGGCARGWYLSARLRPCQSLRESAHHLLTVMSIVPAAQRNISLV